MKKLLMVLLFTVSGTRVFAEKTVTLEEAIKQIAEELAGNSAIEGKIIEVRTVNLDIGLPSTGLPSINLQNNIIKTLTQELYKTVSYKEKRFGQNVKDEGIRKMLAEFVQELAKYGVAVDTANEKVANLIVHVVIEQDALKYKMTINAVPYPALESDVTIVCERKITKTDKTIKAAIKEENKTIAAAIKEENTQKIAAANDTWKNNWFFIGARLGMPLHWYDFSDGMYMVNKNNVPQFGFDPSDPSAFVFDPTAQARLQFKLTPVDSTVFWALSPQVEAIFTKDMVRYAGKQEKPYVEVENGIQQYKSEDYEASFESWSLEVPILLKLLVMSQRLLIAPFGGIYFTIPLTFIDHMKYASNMYPDDKFDFSTPVGWTAGMNVGVRCGPGDIFLDIRYSQDIGNTSIKDDADKWWQIYRRSKASFSIGYEFRTGSN